VISATDALANERTYLAYLRTALAFIGFGFVIAKFSLFAREISVVAHIHAAAGQMSTAFGTGMAAVGIALAIYGGLRYVQTHKALEEGRVAFLTPGAAMTGAIVIAIVGVIVGLNLTLFAIFNSQ
jgi:putative membrane protein